MEEGFHGIFRELEIKTFTYNKVCIYKFTGGQEIEYTWLKHPFFKLTDFEIQDYFSWQLLLFWNEELIELT